MLLRHHRCWPKKCVFGASFLVVATHISSQRTDLDQPGDVHIAQSWLVFVFELQEIAVDLRIAVSTRRRRRHPPPSTSPPPSTPGWRAISFLVKLAPSPVNAWAAPRERRRTAFEPGRSRGEGRFRGVSCRWVAMDGGRYL